MFFKVIVFISYLVALCQVCVRGLCVLEAMLRKKDDEHFLTVGSYFNENVDVVVKCTESPQASVREKANKVWSKFIVNKVYQVYVYVALLTSLNTGSFDPLLMIYEGVDLGYVIFPTGIMVPINKNLAI